MKPALNKSGTTSEDVQWLQKRAYMYDNMTLGPQLAAFCAAQLGSKAFLPPKSFIAITSAYVTPRLSEVLPPGEAEILLNRMAGIHPESVTTRLFQAVTTGLPLDTSQLPEERKQKYAARQLEAQGDYARAAECYRKLWTLAAGKTTYEEDAATGLFRCLMKLGDAAASVAHVVDIYLGKRWLLMSVRLRDLLELS